MAIKTIILLIKYFIYLMLPFFWRFNFQDNQLKLGCFPKLTSKSRSTFSIKSYKLVARRVFRCFSQKNYFEINYLQKNHRNCLVNNILLPLNWNNNNAYRVPILIKRSRINLNILAKVVNAKLFHIFSLSLRAYKICILDCKLSCTFSVGIEKESF